MSSLTFPYASTPEGHRFRPHPLLLSGHLQTLVGTFLGTPAVTYSAKPHRITLEDGDALVIHDDRPAGWTETSPVAVLLHGLCGSHSASYLIRLVAGLNARGIRTFRLDMRGCGDSRMLCRKTTHAGRSQDLLSALKLVATVCPEAPVWLAGISLGGNQVLKLMGETLANPSDQSILQRVSKIVAVAPPVHLQRCADNLERWTMRPYSRYFIRQMIERLPPRAKLEPSWGKVRLDPMPRTMRQFDEHVTAPFCGFEGADDYYERAAAYPHLSQITVPTFVLAAKDDPIIPHKMITTAPWSDSAELEITRYGGHVGYVGWAPSVSWMERRIIDWLCKG